MNLKVYDLIFYWKRLKACNRNFAELTVQVRRNDKDCNILVDKTLSKHYKFRQGLIYHCYNTSLFSHHIKYPTQHCNNVFAIFVVFIP